MNRMINNIGKNCSQQYLGMQTLKDMKKIEKEGKMTLEIVTTSGEGLNLSSTKWKKYKEIKKNHL